jgi:hypothetical protein
MKMTVGVATSTMEILMAMEPQLAVVMRIMEKIAIIHGEALTTRTNIPATLDSIAEDTREIVTRDFKAMVTIGGHRMEMTIPGTTLTMAANAALTIGLVTNIAIEILTIEILMAEALEVAAMGLITIGIDAIIMIMTGIGGTELPMK